MNYDRWLQLAGALSAAPEHDWLDWLEPAEALKAPQPQLVGCASVAARSQHVSEGSLSSLSRSPDSPGSGGAQMQMQMQFLEQPQAGQLQVSCGASALQEAQQATPPLKQSLISELYQQQQQQEPDNSFAPFQQEYSLAYSQQHQHQRQGKSNPSWLRRARVLMLADDNGSQMTKHETRLRAQ